MKDLAGRTSHVLTKTLTVFGQTYLAGTPVKFRPLKVMQLQGEIELPDKTVHWNRGSRDIFSDVAQVIDALDPPWEQQ